MTRGYDERGEVRDPEHGRRLRGNRGVAMEGPGGYSRRRHEDEDRERGYRARPPGARAASPQRIGIEAFVSRHDAVLPQVRQNEPVSAAEAMGASSHPRKSCLHFNKVIDSAGSDGREG